MKKIICSAFAAALALELCACSQIPPVEVMRSADDLPPEEEISATAAPEKIDAMNLDSGILPAEQRAKACPEVDPRHEHRFVRIVKEPTCTEDGYTEYICACGYSYRADVIPAVGHVFGDWKIVKKPTIFTCGKAEHICMGCGMVESRTLPRKSLSEHTHEYEATVLREPTCTEEGLMEYRCSCGDTYTESIPRLEHQFVTEITPPTCVSQGFTTYTCKICGHTFRDNYTAQLPHEFEDTVVPPTDTENGYTLHVCKNCGASYRDEETPALQNDSGE